MFTFIELGLAGFSNAETVVDQSTIHENITEGTTSRCFLLFFGLIFFFYWNNIIRLTKKDNSLAPSGKLARVSQLVSWYLTILPN